MKSVWDTQDGLNSPYRIAGPRYIRCIAQSPLEDIKSILPSFKGSSSTSSASSSSSAPSSWLNNLPVRLPDDPVVVGLLSALGGVALAFGGIAGYRRFWRRIKNSNDVSQRMLDGRKWVKGRVTSVGDGDNFRLYHTPGPFYSLPFKIRRVPTATKDLKDQTLHIRISGVDAPENAHFGNPAQPHAKESWEWLRGQITGKRMKVQLLRKDQYNRIVGVPYIHRRILPNKPLPVMMLKEGMAVVYESGGAEYGPWGLEGLKRVEAQARASKRGLWASRKKFEHPGDYKKRMKLAEEGRAEEAAGGGSRRKRGVWGFISRIFGGR